MSTPLKRAAAPSPEPYHNRFKDADKLLGAMSEFRNLDDTNSKEDFARVGKDIGSIVESALENCKSHEDMKDLCKDLVIELAGIPSKLTKNRETIRVLVGKIRTSKTVELNDPQFERSPGELASIFFNTLILQIGDYWPVEQTDNESEK